MVPVHCDDAAPVSGLPQPRPEDWPELRPTSARIKENSMPHVSLVDLVTVDPDHPLVSVAGADAVDIFVDEEEDREPTKVVAKKSANVIR